MSDTLIKRVLRLAGIPFLTFLFFVLECSDPRYYFYFLLGCFVLSIALWESNRILNVWLNRVLPWDEVSTLRLGVQLLLILLITALATWLFVEWAHAYLTFLGLTALHLKSTEKLIPENNISFYRTNLVCGAAPDIGCGTRAKPILVDFMQREAVDEAWLNHAGTIIAVVWKQNQDMEKAEIANGIFASHGQPFLKLTGSEYEAQLVDFENNKWYKGAEVDQLSMIEAGRIADQIMDSLDGQLNASPQMKGTLRDAFEEYIREAFLKIEDADVIYEIGYWKGWERDLSAIGKEYLGEEMPEIQIVSSSGECKLNNSTCTKDGKSSCCKKGADIN